MHAMRSRIVALLVGFTSATGQDEPPSGITVTIEGIAHDAGMLAALETTARRALADIENIQAVREAPHMIRIERG